MDTIDRKICEIVQCNGRASSAEIAEAVGVSVSTANERVRKLVSNGAITAWRAVLDPSRVNAAFCCFMLIDMNYDGEDAAVAVLGARPEVMELHHISGKHSYLAKIRVADTAALQAFLHQVVKPLAGVERTETVISLQTVKETTELPIVPGGNE